MPRAGDGRRPLTADRPSRWPPLHPGRRSPGSARRARGARDRLPDRLRGGRTRGAPGRVRRGGARRLNVDVQPVAPVIGDVRVSHCRCGGEEIRPRVAPKEGRRFKRRRSNLGTCTSSSGPEPRAKQICFSAPLQYFHQVQLARSDPGSSPWSMRQRSH